VKRLAIAAACLACGIAHGQETTVNVLAVELPPGGYATYIQQQMADLAAHWPNPAGITVTLVDGGYPTYVAGIGIGSGGPDEQLAAAKAGFETYNIRGTVIFFSPYVAPCGIASMDNWDGYGRHAFIPNANGLDLDGADTFYAALVRTHNCPAHTALHEFGHLFSGGHSQTGSGAAPSGWYLLPNNHAYWIAFSYPYQYMSQKTVMTQGGILGTQL
jgi:hypothetical protein